jgi:mono/diheme cytochrome c family protein
MTRRNLAVLLAVVLSARSAGPAPARAEAPGGKLDFNRDIKPILSDKCFRCHGPDPAERKGGPDGLRLDNAAGAAEDLGGYRAIVAGQPEQSELVKRIASTDPDEIMPPPASGKKLSPREIAALSEWVRQGGAYAVHWSYVKPARPELPAVKRPDWVRNPIDRFILARLEAEGLEPSPEADRYALVRRLALDLTGIPPTLAEVDAFVGDADPQAYEKLVDRLLAEPAYGEYWAHLWLDLARYADSAGYADDPPRTIWLFRDYVIRSLNANKPFDTFSIEQIAGDLLPDPTAEQLVATAFHRNTLTNNEGGTNDEEFRNVAVVDRVNTTLAVWMGTTIACAQCHTHKFDPLTQEEYFRLFALFNNTADADRGDESPLYSIYSDEQQRDRAKWQAELAGLEQSLRNPPADVLAAQQRWDQDFPREFKWQSLHPAAASSQAGLATMIAADDSVHVAAGAANDTDTIEIASPPGSLRALRLEALPEDSLPSKGPGHADGNFVLTRLAALIAPPANQTLAGRYVRIELPGKGRMLSLAEVQVFRGSDNVARRGVASQSSTDYDGSPQLALDGNTDGNYAAAKSTTHTAASDDPWWQVDLQSEQPLDRIVVWNRTDGGLGGRLVDFRIVLLGEARQPVWEQTVAVAPNPSSEFSLSGLRSVEFSAAVADYAQPGFDAGSAIKNADPKEKGWAVGGQTGKPHVLTLLTKAPIEIVAGSKLIVTLEQASKNANHTLARFRLSASDDVRAGEVARTPPAVVEVLGLPASERTAAQAELLARHFQDTAAELQPLRDQIAALSKQIAELKPQTVPIQRELPVPQRRITKLQHRGNYLDLGQEVSPGTPAIFPPLAAGASVDRLALARWLVDPDNPLTPRVIANRYWEQIFGIGIVASSEDFGSQGDQPVHPQLLDWLATELVRSKWDTKALLRLLVTSAAYRQSSRVTPELEERDPENRLLARGPRFRLAAEVVRDQALAVSGLLSAKMYGPPVKPPQPALGLSAAFGGGVDWQTSPGEDRYRRALYTTWRRSSPYPSMATFDAPNREVCTVRRIRTNTPLQALVTLNDPVYVEAAQALARRMATEGGSNPAERVRFGFRLCLARPPQAAEAARLLALYEHIRARFESAPQEAVRLATDPLGPAPPELNVAELAAWTVVAGVLLNLDETLMKR